MPDFDAQDTTPYSNFDLKVATDISEIKTTMTEIKDVLKAQQTTYDNQIKACTICKEKIDKRFKPLETFRDRATWVISGLIVIFTLVFGPTITELVKRFFGL